MATTTKVIAHQTPKPVIANCVQKLVAMATFLSTYGPHPTHDSCGPSEPTTPTASLSVQPSLHRRPYDRRVSLYFTMGRPFPPKKICPFPWELDRHLIHSACSESVGGPSGAAGGRGRQPQFPRAHGDGWKSLRRRRRSAGGRSDGSTTSRRCGDSSSSDN